MKNIPYRDAEDYMRYIGVKNTYLCHMCRTLLRRCNGVEKTLLSEVQMTVNEIHWC